MRRERGHASPLNRRIAGGAVAAVCGLWAILVILAGRYLLAPSVDDRFHLLRWEILHVPRTYTHAAGAWLRRAPSPGRDDVSAYFAGRDVLQESERRGDPETARLRAEATALRPAAEAAVERDISDAARTLGLTRSPWLTLRQPVVWPPVDVAFDETPFVLVISRTDRVQLIRTELLRPGLTPDDMARIEAREEQAGVSALVEPLSGFAAYPSIVRVTDGEQAAVEIAAHEWIHHYLAFFPLGQAYGRDSALTTINETVADIAGGEVAELVLRDLAPAPRPPGAPVTVNAGTVLRAARTDVDALLQRGDLGGADERMERARRELQAGGVYIRKINQAWFAFHNLYATSAGATNPIGPALAALRARSTSLAAFMAAVRGITTDEQFQQLVSRGEASASP